MKKIILTVFLFISFFIVSSFANAATELKKVLWIVTDSSGVEWCDFPFANESSNDTTVSAIKKKDGYVQCKVYWLWSTTSSTIEKYKIAYPNGKALIYGTEICIEKWLEVSCESWEEAEPIKEEVTPTEDTSLEDTSLEDTSLEHDELNGSWTELWTWVLDENEEEIIENTWSLDNSWSLDVQTSTWTVTWKCMSNWVEVDCGEAIGWIFAMWAKILLILWVVMFIFFIFWLWMFIHAISNKIPNKFLWIIILIFLSYLWAIIYYFVVKRKFAEAKIDADSELMI